MKLPPSMTPLKRVAGRVGVRTTELVKLCQEREIALYKFGTSWRIADDDVDVLCAPYVKPPECVRRQQVSDFVELCEREAGLPPRSEQSGRRRGSTSSSSQSSHGREAS